MSPRTTDLLRTAGALVGYFLLGAAAPWILLIGEARSGDGLGVVGAIAAAIVGAIGLNWCCRRLSVHVVGALAAYAGWTVGGGVMLDMLFGSGSFDLGAAMLITGWVGLWSALPIALVINALTALIMQQVYPRRPRFGDLKCAQCAYDLRGLGHGRCPECGTHNRLEGAAI